jgi:microcystin degradation protein MlrC
MRIAIAAVGQETGSFTSHRTTLDDFRQKGLVEGEAIIEKTAGVGCLGGFLAVAEEQDAEIVVIPIINAWASAGGVVTEDTLDFFREKIVTGLRQAGPIDGFFFSLHGGAATDATPDFEGDLLRAARGVIGDDIPLVVPFDHHASITQPIVDAVDALVGYRTQPHDQFDTGKAAARILFSIIRGEISPTIAWRRIPMIAHQEQFMTSQGPMKEWFDLARHMETQPGVVSVSTFPMQPWLDVPEGGWTAVVITDGNPDLAEALAIELANKAWSLREKFWVMDSIPPAEAVRRAIAAPRGLVVLSDTGDSVFGGANGDSTVILRELLVQNVPQMALVSILDPRAVEIATQAGIGAGITVDLGATIDPTFYEPVRVTARVAGLASGRVHAKVSSYESFDPGHVALLEAGQVRIMVSELRGVAGNHPMVYQRFGIDPGQAKMIVVKTASNWHYFGEWISEVIRVDTPGPTMSHLEKLPWQRLPRPIYPLDEMRDWQA